MSIMNIVGEKSTLNANGIYMLLVVYYIHYSSELGCKSTSASLPNYSFLILTFTLSELEDIYMSF